MKKVQRPDLQSANSTDRHRVKYLVKVIFTDVKYFSFICFINLEATSGLYI